MTKCNDISPNFHFRMSRQNEQSESGNWLRLAVKHCLRLSYNHGQLQNKS